MAFFKKTYTSTDFTRLGQKHNYRKLVQLLGHKDLSVVAMAEDALHQLISDEDEKKHRAALYKAYPALYDNIIKKLEVAQKSNPNLRNVTPIIGAFIQESEPVRTKKKIEQQEIEALCTLLKEKGVTQLCAKNLGDLKARLEADEMIECATQDGQRGGLVACFDYSLYTNKNMHILRGFANHKDWGRFEKISYDAIHDIKETGVFIKKYQVVGKQVDTFSFTVGRDHLLLRQLAKYGREEVKDTMRQLGLLLQVSKAQ